MLRPREDELDAAVASFFGEETKFNVFYRQVSGLYRVVEFLFLFAFLGFVVISAAVNAEDLNYKNIEYIVRNFAMELEENERENSTVKYAPDGESDFASLGSGLVVCGKTRLNFYSASGREISSEVHNFLSPVLRSSEKYVLLYNRDGNTYRVYNMFSELHSETLDGTILSVCVANDGYYAVTVTSENYTSEVRLYDKNFHLVSRVFKNGYVISTDLRTGGELLVCTLSVNGSGAYAAELITVRPGESESVASAAAEGMFPLYARFVADGFCLVSDADCRFFDADGKATGTYAFPCKPADVRFGEACVALIFPGDSVEREVTAVLLGAGAEEILSRKISASYFDVALESETILFLGADGITAIDRDAMLHTSVADCRDGDRILPYSETHVYVCRPTGAVPVKLAALAADND